MRCEMFTIDTLIRMGGGVVVVVVVVTGEVGA
jgi:hypothetical protein